MDIQEKIESYLTEEKKPFDNANRTEAYVGTFVEKSAGVQSYLNSLMDLIKAGKGPKQYAQYKDKKIRFRWVARGPRESRENFFGEKERNAYTLKKDATHYDVYIQEVNNSFDYKKGEYRK